MRTFFGNSVLDYAVCMGTFAAGIFVIYIFKFIFISRLKKLAQKTDTAVDDFFIDAMDKKLPPLLYFAAFYIGIQGLTLHPVMQKGLHVLTLVIFTLLGVRFLMTLIVYGLETYWVGKEMNLAKQNVLKGMVTAVKFMVWGLAIVILLDNMGIKISALVAGLGIGGIAIALAAQAILGDLFSYFIIFFDRPFETGDFIITGDYLGTIEHVGIKSTRIRSLSGELLIFSNTDLTNSRIRNYKKMINRRVVFKLGVTYQTSTARLKEIPGIIREIINNTEGTIFDRSHFASYGDFSLNFETVFYVVGSDYNRYMDLQQAINFRINEEFEKRKIDFAYPTQTLYINKA